MINEFVIALLNDAPKARTAPNNTVQFNSNALNENSSNCPMVTKPNPVNPKKNKMKTQMVKGLNRLSLRFTTGLIEFSHNQNF